MPMSFPRLLQAKAGNTGVGRLEIEGRRPEQAVPVWFGEEVQEMLHGGVGGVFTSRGRRTASTGGLRGPRLDLQPLELARGLGIRFEM